VDPASAWRSGDRRRDSILVPVTTLIGGYALLVVFGMAALVHLLHGQFGVEGLVLYAVAVLVCITYRKIWTAEGLHDRT